MCCKDCLYAEVCPGFEVTQINCDKFKDRQKFVELPCKVGDTVYFANCELQEVCLATVSMIEINFYTRYRNPIWLRIEYKSNLIGFHEYHCPTGEIGKTVFFTREAAEKALKESEDK